MPRFAANLTTMFAELPFLDRFRAAAEAGFRGIEFLFPYDYSPAVLRRHLRESRLESAMFNCPAGDWARGERGMACVPGRELDFRRSVDLAISYAVELGTRKIHVMAGIVPEGVDQTVCLNTFIENLRFAADRFAKEGMSVLIEALNTRDMPGYFLNLQADACAICTAANAPNIEMQMDCYHIQIQEGDLASKLRRYAPNCGHIQIAGVPDRNEPDRGEVNYPFLFKLLDEVGYKGWVGCEYRPTNRTADGLGWFERWSEES